MKIHQEVILLATGKRIPWRQAAEIIGGTDRMATLYDRRREPVATVEKVRAGRAREPRCATPQGFRSAPHAHRAKADRDCRSRRFG